MLKESERVSYADYSFTAMMTVNMASRRGRGICNNSGDVAAPAEPMLFEERESGPQGSR